MSSFFSYFSARVREPSTIAGLGLVASSVATALNAGGSKGAFVAAGLQLMTGVVASIKADPVAVVPASVVAPVASVSEQVASMASELSAVATSIASVAAVVPAAAPKAV